MRRRMTAMWTAVHAVGAFAATILLIGAFRLTTCPPSVLTNGNSGPFAYTSGDEYVRPALWLSLAYFVVGVAAFIFTLSRANVSPKAIGWGAANLIVVLIMSIMNWLSSAAQDDHEVLCGSAIGTALAFLALPYVVVIAANLFVMRRAPKS